jgi:hypothetical protein
VIGRELATLGVFGTTRRDSNAKAHGEEKSSIAPGVKTHSEGIVAGQRRAVECRYSSDMVSVHIDGVCMFTIADGGESIEVLKSERTSPRDLVEEALLGPPMLIALAMRGVVVLHAAAVVRHGEGIALLGGSGSGKSTLAEYLDRKVTGWTRCADDLLPLAGGSEGVDCFPHFPQLKLESEDQWCPPKPERLPLRAVYILDTESPSPSGISIEALSPGDATVAVVKHSAAWTCFPPGLTQRHLAFCALIADTTPFRRIAYPRRVETLPDVAAAIRDDLNSNRESFDSFQIP